MIAPRVYEQAATTDPAEVELADVQTRLEDAQRKKTEAARRNILLGVLEANEVADVETTAGLFSNALATVGFKDVAPTETELSTISRAVDIAQAERPPSREEVAQAEQIAEDTPKLAEAEQDRIQQYPPGEQTAELESAVPEKAPPPEGQILAFPEITPKQPKPETNRREGDVQEEPRPITKGLLDSMGVAPKAPLRKRITGKDAADPANFDLISKELMNYANNPAVPVKTTADVLARDTARQRIPAFLRAIAPVENTQMEMFGLAVG